MNCVTDTIMARLITALSIELGSGSRTRTWTDSSLGFKKRQIIYQSAALAAQTAAVYYKPTWGNTVNGLHLCGWMTGTTAAHLVIYDMSNPSAPVEIEVPTTTGLIYGCAYSRDGSMFAICESTTPWVEFFDTSTIPYTKIGDGVQNGNVAAVAGCPLWSRFSSDPKRFYCISANKLFRFSSVDDLVCPNSNQGTAMTGTGLTGLICESNALTVYTANKITSGSATIVRIKYTDDTFYGTAGYDSYSNSTLNISSLSCFKASQLFITSAAAGIAIYDIMGSELVLSPIASYGGTYAYSDIAGTTMGGEFGMPHIAALAASAGVIEYADTGNRSMTVDNYTTLPSAYATTYGVEFSPDGNMLAFFHSKITTASGSSIMSLLYV
jgi:hypothetical protein